MYSLSFTGFFKQYRIKNIWSPLGIEPRTALVHKRSATELRQPPGEQTHQFCIYTFKGVLLCYNLTLNRLTKFLFFQRFLLFVEFFSLSNLSLHNFFLSLLLLIS